MPAVPKAIALKVLSAAIFAVLWVLIRYASETLPPPLIVFYRTLFGLLFMGTLFARSARGLMKTARLPLHLLRGLSGVAAMYLTFFAVSLAPLANVVAISYATPLFATVAAVLLLDERIRARRMTALLIGFAGVLLVLRPGLHMPLLGEWLALGSAVMVAFSLTCVKLLARSERPETIVLFSFIVALPINFAVALFFWRWPSPWELVLLAAIGIGANLGQITMTRAFALADASALLPFDFVRLLVASALAAALFGERLDAWTAAGAGIILAASVYLAHRERQLARAASRSEAAARSGPAGDAEIQRPVPPLSAGVEVSPPPPVFHNRR
ncbi:MAG: membrane protein [Rhodothalassiaceae bacterium]|nr:MAG: membrane protein [Rhodothalassiaceae bacterium]